MMKHKQISSGGPVDEDVKETLSDLRAIREALGWSLKDVFEKTRISDTHLDAIEREQFHRLPPPIYSRSFIKSYANILETDYRPFLAIYEKYLESQKGKASGDEPNQPDQESISGKNYHKIAWVSVASIAALAVILAIFINNRTLREDARNQIVHPPQNVAPASSAAPALSQTPLNTKNNFSALVPAQATVPASPNAAAPVNNSIVSSTDTQGPAVQETEAYSENYHLSIEAKDLTWLRIIEDGKEPYQVLMKSGEKLERNARKTFLLDVGNADGVEIKFQGRSLGKLGQAGQVVHLKLP